MPHRKLLIVAAIVLAVGVAGLASWLPRTSFFLRTQVAPELPGSLTRTFSWSPTSKANVGEHTLTVVATDQYGNTTTKEIPITVEDQDLAISEVTAAPTATEA